MHQVKNDVPDGDIRGHWYLDLEPEDEDFETHWRVKSTGKKIEKDKALLVSTQTGFEMMNLLMGRVTTDGVARPPLAPGADGSLGEPLPKASDRSF
eukprot:COSAG03_NODE_5893_length_1154_cov_4.021801_2_plen_96_part_00